MKKEAVEKEVDKLWMEYEQQIYTIANRVFQQYIKPFCIKNKYEFVSGMGGWCICNSKGTRDIIEDKNINNSILNLLETEVPGIQLSLGALMPSYKKGGIK